MKNPKKVFALSFITIFICLLIIITIFSNKNVRIFIYEANYKNNVNSENLTKLCLNLRNTNQYNKKIQYFPNLLYDAKAFNNVTKFMTIDSDINKIYDEMQYEYLFSYLYTNQFDTFKRRYVELFPRFKTSGYKYEYLMVVALDKKTTAGQLEVILKALQNNLPFISSNQLEQIGNYNTQSLIYEQLGDSKNKKAVDMKTKKIIEAMGKSKQQ